MLSLSQTSFPRPSGPTSSSIAPPFEYEGAESSAGSVSGSGPAYHSIDFPSLHLNPPSGLIGARETENRRPSGWYTLDQPRWSVPTEGSSSQTWGARGHTSTTSTSLSPEQSPWSLGLSTSGPSLAAAPATVPAPMRPEWRDKGYNFPEDEPRESISSGSGPSTVSSGSTIFPRGSFPALPDTQLSEPYFSPMGSGALHTSPLGFSRQHPAVGPGRGHGPSSAVAGGLVTPDLALRHDSTTATMPIHHSGLPFEPLQLSLPPPGPSSGGSGGIGHHHPRHPHYQPAMPAGAPNFAGPFASAASPPRGPAAGVDVRMGMGPSSSSSSAASPSYPQPQPQHEYRRPPHQPPPN